MPRPSCLAALALLLLPAAAAAQPPLRFTLEDQFQRSHTAAALLKASRPLIVIGGDQRKTDAAIKRWLAPLRKALGARARVVGYVDLREVPFFVPNAAIRSGLRKTCPKTPVLCDYKGRAAAALGFAPKTLVQVRVFDARGRALGGVRGPYSAARLKRVRTLLDGR